jgi:hypothetical protein
MHLLSRFLSISLLLSTPLIFAQNSNPLWTNFDTGEPPVAEFIDLTTYAPSPEPEESVSGEPILTALALSAPESGDAQIVELAGSLDNDPLRNFNFQSITLVIASVPGNADVLVGSNALLRWNAGGDRQRSQHLAGLTLKTGS